MRWKDNAWQTAGYLDRGCLEPRTGSKSVCQQGQHFLIYNAPSEIREVNREAPFNGRVGSVADVVVVVGR
jgi:hypothetical protein